MNCLIVDDDPIMSHIMESLISDFDFLKLRGIAHNVTDAMKILENDKIDLIFLDVEMPNITGIEFLSFFPLNNTKVIIISSHEKYAIQSYNFEVSDYLLKPVDKARFYKAILKIKDSTPTQNNLPSKDNKSIFIKVNSIYQSILFEDILYLESMGDYLHIHTTAERFTVYSSLKKIGALLPEEHFFRIHNSFIVRIDKISKFEENMVFIDKVCLPISRANKTALLKVLNIL